MALLLGTKKTNYAYAVARVQAKRGKLIPRSEYDKLLKMDVAEITRFIQDSEYKEEVDELAARFSGLDLLEAALTVNEERVNAISSTTSKRCCVANKPAQPVMN